MAFYQVKKLKPKDKYYPVAVLVDVPMEIDEIAEQISEMCTATKSDILAVLSALPTVMGRGMNAGRSVHLPEIGNFRYTINARDGGRDTADEVTAEDIEGVRIRFTPETHYTTGRTATRSLVDSNIRWTLWRGAAVDDGTDTDTETEEPGGEGESSNPLS